MRCKRFEKAFAQFVVLKKWHLIQQLQCKSFKYNWSSDNVEIWKISCCKIFENVLIISSLRRFTLGLIALLIIENRAAGKNLVSDAEFYDGQNRTIKTAPERPRRRKWQMRSVEIKTNSGESVRIKPPGSTLLWLYFFLRIIAGLWLWRAGGVL